MALQHCVLSLQSLNPAQERGKADSLLLLKHLNHDEPTFLPANEKFLSKKQRGFTLIELLVVLFIISIVSGTVLMTISRSATKEVQAVTNEIAQSITLAQEQAMLQPVVLGMDLTANSFQFYSYQSTPNKKGKWVAMDDDVFKAHSIPSNVAVTLAAGNQKSDSDEEDQTEDAHDNSKSIQPEILISTSGDVTPFTIYVGKKGGAPMYVITGDSNGSITVKHSGEQ